MIGGLEGWQDQALHVLGSKQGHGGVGPRAGARGELGHRATWACARQAGHVLQFGVVWRITWASHAERASLGARAGLETRAGLEPRVGLRALGTTR
ncbi:unnamed protein product [Prunus armeniaca]